jgi:hypothetical protein
MNRRCQLFTHASWALLKRQQRCHSEITVNWLFVCCNETGAHSLSTDSSEGNWDQPDLAIQRYIGSTGEKTVPVQQAIATILLQPDAWVGFLLHTSSDGTDIGAKFAWLLLRHCAIEVY